MLEKLNRLVAKLVSDAIMSDPLEFLYAIMDAEAAEGFQDDDPPPPPSPPPPNAAQVRDVSDACYEGACSALQQHYDHLAGEAFEAAEMLRILASDIDEGLPVDPGELSRAIVAAQDFIGRTAEFRVICSHEMRARGAKALRFPSLAPDPAVAGVGSTLRAGDLLTVA